MWPKTPSVPLRSVGKNWLFSGSPKGAAASAALYSLVETAKANSLEPLRYLHFLFKRLPYMRSADERRGLLPQYLAAEELAWKKMLKIGIAWKNALTQEQ